MPFISQALKNGENQVGIWVSLVSTAAAEIVAGAGFDFAVIDMEHSPNSEQTVIAQLQAFSGFDTPAIVRPPWNDSVMVKRLLDAGAPGLLFPMVQSVAEAKSAVAASHYPPNGVRGVAGGIRGT